MRCLSKNDVCAVVICIAIPFHALAQVTQFERKRITAVEYVPSQTLDPADLPRVGLEAQTPEVLQRLESLQKRGLTTETRRNYGLKSGDLPKGFFRGCFHPWIPAAEGLA